MPLYDYYCEECQTKFESFSSIAGRNRPKTCPKCKAKATRDFKSELANMGHVDEMMRENERWSWSMGCNPNNIKEMCRKYPGSEYNERGQLRIKSRTHKLHEMRRRNYEEY